MIGEDGSARSIAPKSDRKIEAGLKPCATTSRVCHGDFAPTRASGRNGRSWPRSWTGWARSPSDRNAKRRGQKFFDEGLTFVLRSTTTGDQVRSSARPARSEIRDAALGERWRSGRTSTTASTRTREAAYEPCGRRWRSADAPAGNAYVTALAAPARAIQGRLEALAAGCGKR